MLNLQADLQKHLLFTSNFPDYSEAQGRAFESPNFLSFKSLVSSLSFLESYEHPSSLQQGEFQFRGHSYIVFSLERELCFPLTEVRVL